MTSDDRISFLIVSDVSVAVGSGFSTVCGTFFATLDGGEVVADFECLSDLLGTGVIFSLPDRDPVNIHGQ